MRIQNATTKLWALVLLVLLGTQLRAQVTADFTASATSGCSLPFQVQFTDLSTTTSGTLGQRIWNFGNSTGGSGTNPTATYTQPGIYNVTLITRTTSGLADTLVKTAYIDLSGAFTVTTTVTDASCYNCPDGSISVNPNGGMPPYSYLWSNGAATPTPTGLEPNTYSVTVTDANGCSTMVSNIRLRVICQPIDVEISVYKSPSCHGGGDGILHSTTTGGRAPYSYLWYDPSFCWGCPPNPPGPAQPDTVGNAMAGLYILYVYDQDGCAGVDSLVVATPDPIFITANATPASCLACADGELEIFTRNGVAPFQYSIDNGITFQSSNTFAGLTRGNKPVVAMDANGCQSSGVFFVDTLCSYTVFKDSVNLLCAGGNDGKAWVSMVGSTAPYNISWSTGATGDTIRNLVAGNYGYTVSDGGNCSTFGYVAISQPAPLSIAMDSINISCHGQTDGKAWVTAMGGVGTYTYVWSTAPPVTFDTIFNRPAGLYHITVSDANGCTVAASVTIAEPDTFAATVNTTDVTCFGLSDGTAFITTMGGTPIDTTGSGGLGFPYYYSWSTGATDPYNLQNLVAGIQSATVTDANGCEASVMFTILQPSEIVINEVITPPTCPACSDGVIDQNVTGGVPPYTSSWSNGATTVAVTGLSAGTYTLTVTDANGCFSSATYQVGNCTFTVDLMPDTALCFGLHGLTPTLVGGAAPYNYLWSTTENTATIAVSTTGLYTVTVTDANNCQAQDSVRLTNANPSAGVTPNSVICLGNSIQLNATGGNTYAWGPQAGLSDANIANPIASPTVTTTYFVEVDNGTCVSSLSVTITVLTDCVWPGDADNSGTADNDDVLAIGLGYGDTGPVRTNASTVWEGQPANNWANALPNGANYRYVDTNGDGTIDADDTLAITLNYGLTHPKTDEARDGNAPSIYIELPDSVEAGQTVQGTLLLGSSDFPLTDIYGVKFSMNYNPDFVEENSISFSFGPSWMGTPGTDLLTFQKDLYTSGRIDGAITGINHMNRTGYGAIGNTNFTMKDDISGKDLIAAPMLFTFTYVRAIDANGDTLTVEGSEIEVIATQTVGIKPMASTLPVAIYPNPAQGTIYINAYNQPLQHIQMQNVIGHSIEVPLKQQSGIYLLDVQGLPAGVYIITLQSANQIAVKRVVVQ